MRSNKNIFLTILASIFSLIIFSGCNGCSDAIRVTGVDFAEPVVELRVGDMYELNAVVAPADADNLTVLLTSDGALSTNDEEVILFQRNKKILANAPGQSVVTARTQDGSFTDTVTIRVFDNDVKLSTPTNLRLEGNKITWDKVSYYVGTNLVDADAYIVTVNGIPHEVGGNMLEFAGYDLNINNVVTVQAISNTDEAYRVVENSEVSNELHFNKLAAPTGLTREGNLLTWSAVEGAAGYQLIINGVNRDTLITTNSTIIDFDEAGSYVVKVVAIPEQNENNSMYQSDPSQPISLMKLGRVENIKMENYILSYDALDNASGYIITVKGANKTYTIDNATFTSLDFSRYVDENGDPIQMGSYEVSILATNNSTQGVNGIPSTPFRLTKLSGVKNTQISSDAFAWSRVTGATSYEVQVTYTYNDEETTLTQSIAADGNTRFYLPADAPETTYHFSVKVHAAGTLFNGDAYLSSDWVDSNLDPVKLSAPKNVTHDDTTFIFDEVEGAVGYDILIDGVAKELEIEKVVDKVVYASTILPSKVTSINEILDNSYYVYLRANGGSVNFNSVVTDPIAISVLPKPEVISIDRENNLSITMSTETMTPEVVDAWASYNLEALGYEVIVEQIRLGRTHSTRYEYPIERVSFADLEPGTVTIKARKYGDGARFISSDYAVLVTTKEAELEDVKASGNMITWKQVIGATYAINFNNVYQTLTTNEYIIPDTVMAGSTIKATLYNLGKTNSITSKGVEYTFTRLPSPTVSLNGNTVSWTRVDGAAKYRVRLLYNGQIVKEYLTENADELSYSGYNFDSLGAHQVRVSAVPEAVEGNMVFASIDGVLNTNKLGFTEEDEFKVESETLKWTFNDCGAKVDEIDFTLVLHNTLNTYTFTELNGHEFYLFDKNVEAGTYTLSISASYVGEHRNDFVDSSVYYPSISIQFLDDPSNIERHGDEIAWNPVSGVSKYKVVAIYPAGEGLDPVVIEADAFIPSIDLTQSLFVGGNFTLTVQSVANNDSVTDGRYKVSSQVVNVDGTFEKLNPAIITSSSVVGENYVINVEEVTEENIDIVYRLDRISGVQEFTGHYEIVEDGTVTRALENMESEGTYKFWFSVKDSSANKISSTASLIEVVRYGELGNLRIEEGDLVWDEIPGATFEVVITSGDNTITNTVTTNRFNISTVVNNPDSPLPSGNYSIKARALGDNTTSLTSVDYTVVQNQFRVLPASDSISLDSENKVLTWAQVTNAEGYTLVFRNVADPTLVILKERLERDELTSEIPSELIGGNWNVSVITLGNGVNIIDSSESQPVAIYKIPTPTNVTHSGETIIISQVQGFIQYQIEIESVDSKDTFDFVYTDGTFTGYDFSQAGTYIVRVKAFGDYITNIDSDFSEPLIINKTAMVTGAKVENEKVKFDRNEFVTPENNTYYSVKFINPEDENDFVEKQSKEIEVDFSGINAGAYTISVSIITEDVGLLPSEECFITDIYKLETPENLPQLNGLDYTWDMPLNYGGAGAYTVKEFVVSVNGKEVSTELEKKFTLGSEYPQGTYTIKVKAVGDGNKLISSDYTADFVITKLASTTVRIVREETATEISDYKIVWDAVENALSYKLSLEIAGIKQVCDVGDITSINIDDLTEAELPDVYGSLQQYGTMTVNIIPIGNGVEYANGETSSPIQYNKININDAQLRVEEGILTWNNLPSDITAFVLRVTNIDTLQVKEFSVHNVNQFFLDNTFPSATYAISLKGYTNDANSNNAYINTNFSEEITAFKLATPAQPIIKNGKFEFTTINFDKDMSVYPYEMEYGGKVTQFTVVNKEQTKVSLASDTNYKALQDNKNVFYSDSSNKGLVRLRAVGDSHHLTSDWSSAGVEQDALVYGRQLSMVTGLESANGVITWNPVPNAKGYHVYAQTTTFANEDGDDFVYAYAVTDISTTVVNIRELLSTAGPGTYSVAIIAVGDSYFTDSQLSSERVEVSLLDVCEIETENGLLVWQDPMGLAVGYTLKIYSYETKTEVYKDITDPYYAMIGEAAGRYRISVMVRGDNNFTLSSEYGPSADVYKISELVERNDTSTFLKDGKISGVLPTEFADSNVTGKSAEAFLNQVADFSNGVKAVFKSRNTGVEEVVTMPASFSSAFLYRNDNPIDLEPGLYEVIISVVGNSTSMMESDDEDINKLFVSSGYTATLEMEILRAPVVYEVENGILEWNPVSAVTSIYPQVNYVVSINNYVREDVTQTQINFNVDAPEGEKTKFKTGVAGIYTTLIAARGDSTRYLTSAFSEQTKLTVLEYPAENTDGNAIVLDDGVITWLYSEHVQSYELYIYGVSEGITGNRYAIKGIVPEAEDIKDGRVYYKLPDVAPLESGVMKEIFSGDYQLQIRAIGDGTEYLTSAYSPLQDMSRLTKVEQLRNDKGILTWKINTSAYYYQLHIVGKDETNVCDLYYNVYVDPASNVDGGFTNATINEELGIVEFELSDDNYFRPGAFDISICAVGNDINMISSAFTTAETFIKLAAPTDLRVEGGRIVWTEVPFAPKGYYMFVDDDRISKTFELGQAELPQDYIGSPDNQFKIQVQAIGNSYADSSTRYLNSSKSDLIDNVKKLINVRNFKIVDGMMVWDDLPEAVGYELKFPETPSITDESRFITRVVNKDVRSHNLNGYDPGTYSKIMIRALGDSAWLNGNYIALENVTKLVSPQAGFKFEEEKITVNRQTYKTTDGVNIVEHTVKVYEFLVENVDTGRTETRVFDISGQLEGNDRTLEIDFPFGEFGSGVLKIYVRAVPEVDPDGVMRAISSNYIADPITIQIPDSPRNLRFDRENFVFTWDAVEGADITYTVYYAKVTKNMIDEDIILDDASWGMESGIKTNYFYPSALGGYTIIVRANSSGQIFSPYLGDDSGEDYIITETDEIEIRRLVAQFGVQGYHGLFQSGLGTEENPYVIKNATQLSNMRYYPYSYYQLGDNLNLYGSSLTPIGSPSAPFRGSFDGAGYTIMNYTYSNESTAETGLFGYTLRATLKNIIMTNVNLTSYPQGLSQSYIGAIVGRADNTVIMNCDVSGSVDFDTRSASSGIIYYAGGIIGYGVSTTVMDCVSNINVANNFSEMIKSTSYIYTVNAGGIAAYLDGQIVRCINKGMVKGTNFIGGIVGQSVYSYTNTASISECKNAGRIEAVSMGTSINPKYTYVGGIVGRNYLNSSGTYTQLIVEFCYNTGAITLIGNNYSNIYAGGFAGYSNAKIQGFYTNGRFNVTNAKGNKFVGGIVGRTDQESQIYTDSNGNSLTNVVVYHAYFDTSCGANNAAGTNKVTYMKNTPDEYWNDEYNAPGASASYIYDYLIDDCLNTKFVEPISGNYPVLSFELED